MKGLRIFLSGWFAWNVYGSEKTGDLSDLFSKASDGTKMSINGDGLQERDYVFDDVVSGMIAVRDKLSGFDIVNIATGTSSTSCSYHQIDGECCWKKNRI